MRRTRILLLGAVLLLPGLGVGTAQARGQEPLEGGSRNWVCEAVPELTKTGLHYRLVCINHAPTTGGSNGR